MTQSPDLGTFQVEGNSRACRHHPPVMETLKKQKEKKRLLYASMDRDNYMPEHSGEMTVKRSPFDK